MEDLNKTQLILLMLFVSFVTSIATGVVTVTLLEQAPKSVTQQINRVVERTVEKIVPGPGETKTVNTTTQVVVSEDDLIIQAVQKTSPALVRIRVPASTQALATSTAASLASVGAIETIADAPSDTFITGVVVSDGGRIISSPTGLFSTSDVDKEFSVLLTSTTTEQEARLVYVSDEQNLVVFDIVTTKSGGKFASIPFPAGKLSLGQTLVLMDLTNGVTPSVSVGRITNLVLGNASSSPVVSTNIDTNNSILGDPLVDTNGSFAGFLKKSGKVTPFDGIKTLLNKGFSAPIDKNT